MSLLGLQVQQDLVFDSERGLFSFRVGFSAKSVWDLHILSCPVFKVIEVLTEAGQPSPLSIIQAALGQKILSLLWSFWTVNDSGST